MSNLYREPNKHTCPQIDDLKLWLESALRVCNNPDSADSQEEILQTVKDYIYDIPDILEELRNSNSELREWGNDLVSECESKDLVIENLNSENANLNKEIDDLKSDLDNLAYEIEKLKEITAG